MSALVVSLWVYSLPGKYLTTSFQKWVFQFDMSEDTKIFIVGFNKCGTRALHQFFADNGLKSVHWDNNALALSMWDQIRKGENPTAKYPTVQVFSDMECVSEFSMPPIEIFLHFEKLYEWYPNAYFVLNTRSIERWVISRIYHLDGYLLECWKHHYGTRDVLEVITRWRKSWMEHHKNVRQFFADKPGSLLEFNLDTDEPIKLCQHFERSFSLNAALFKIVGESSRAPKWSMKNVGEAIAAQQAVLEIDPSYAGAHSLLSLIFEHHGDCANALLHAEQACRLMPDSPEFRYRLEKLQH